MGKEVRNCYYKKSSSSSCHKCSSCSSSSSSSSCSKCSCCSSGCSSSAYTIDECRRAANGGNWHARRCSCSSSSSSSEASVCKSTSASCNPCRYDISQQSCCSESSDCCSSSSGCCSSSSSDCYSSSSSSSCSSSSSDKSCDPYYIWGEKPIKKKLCKDGYKCKAYKWKYGLNKCKHGNVNGQCDRGCKAVCCTKQYAKKKYVYNDYDAAKAGKYDCKFGKNKCSKGSSSSSVNICPGCPKPACAKSGKEKKM